MNILENNKPDFILALEKHINFFDIIPTLFFKDFYKKFGRKHKHQLESLLCAFVLQKLLNLSDPCMKSGLKIMIDC